MKRPEPLLMVADSEHDADMLYATGLFVPDPFTYLRRGGRATLLMSDLELDRARRLVRHARVLPLSAFQQRLQRTGLKRPGLAHVIRAFLRQWRLRRVVVPRQFPLGLARELEALGVRVQPARGPVFPQREQKSPREVKKISAALLMAEVGMAEAIQVLHASRIGRDGRLLYQGAPLTSEKLRGVIDCAVLRANGLPAHTIVAGGRQACDPHEPGHGPLRAHEPIIIDIFPRSQRTGYFGDITRTVVRGRASEAVRRLYDTVRRAQERAFERIRAGVKAAHVHRAVQEFFEREGYPTRRRDNHMEGFFHGTGHGLGLEIHEAPRLSLNSTDTLKPGHVVTVEPGLYYPELGGVRIEDVVLVGERGARNLTRFEKVLEV